MPACPKLVVVPEYPRHRVRAEARVGQGKPRAE